jgi:tripartite-type tricarboxylate transporter receptor subunit TctC
MTMTRRVLAVVLALMLMCAPAMAQYPDKPVKLVVPFPPGGPTDVFARVLSAALAEQLGQQVVIENKGGAGGTVGTDLVAKAKPDGYTLLFGTAATHGINVSLYDQLPYDP